MVLDVALQLGHQVLTDAAQGLQLSANCTLADRLLNQQVFPLTYAPVISTEQCWVDWVGHA